MIVLYPYDVGRTVCVERWGANPFGFAKAAYPAPLFSAIHCVAEWHTPQASYAKNTRRWKYLDPFLCLILLRSAHLYNTEESIKLLPPSSSFAALSL